MGGVCPAKIGFLMMGSMLRAWILEAFVIHDIGSKERRIQTEPPAISPHENGD